jgi:hypothetical protein
VALRGSKIFAIIVTVAVLVAIGLAVSLKVQQVARRQRLQRIVR